MLKLILTILYVLVCITLSVVVLMQEGKQRGLGALSGGNTFWETNRTRSTEYLPVRITRICAVLFFVLSVILSILH